MKEIINFLKEFKTELVLWIEEPTVSAPLEPMKKILSTVELSIELVNTNRSISLDEKQMFEGGAYLARYFDGWGEIYFDKYLEIVNYIKKNHY